MRRRYLTQREFMVHEVVSMAELYCWNSIVVEADSEICVEVAPENHYSTHITCKTNPTIPEGAFHIRMEDAIRYNSQDRLVPNTCAIKAAINRWMKK